MKCECECERQEQERQQIPFGNDRKKNKNRSEGEISGGWGQELAGFSAGSVHHLVVVSDGGEDFANGVEFDRVSLFGFGDEDFEFAVEAETVMLEELFEFGAGDQRGFEGEEGVAELLDLLVFGVVEFTDALTVRTVVA